MLKKNGHVLKRGREQLSTWEGGLKFPKNVSMWFINGFLLKLVFPKYVLFWGLKKAYFALKFRMVYNWFQRQTS